MWSAFFNEMNNPTPKEQKPDETEKQLKGVLMSKARKPDA
jgi:hypothetical protein